MVCETLGIITSFSDFLVWPVTCDYYFYLKVLLALWVILAGSLKIAEKKDVGRGDFIGSLGVSTIGIDVLAIIGSLVSNSSDIPMISAPILLTIIGLSIPIYVIWIFRD